MPTFFSNLVATGTPQVRRVLTGLFLITAFAATSAVLLFVITAEQLQTSVNSPDIAQFKPTIGSIRQYVAEIERYYAIDDAVTKKQADVDASLFKENLDTQAALAQMTAAADDVRAFINIDNTVYIHPPLTLIPFTGKLPQTAAAPGAAPVADATQPAPETANTQPNAAGAKAAPQPAASQELLGLPDALAAYFIGYYTQASRLSGDAAGGADKAIDEFKAQTFKHFAAYADARAKYDTAQSQIYSLKGQSDALTAQENNYYYSIIGKDPITGTDSPLHTDAYWNLCEDFYSFKSLVGDWAYNIVLFPKMMLVLILAIFMGILGSLIYISQDFLKNPDGRGFWDILFRVGLGAGVAFALFFFAAAGMLSLSQNASGTQTEMSPYLISFLGITGGYLSDRVTEWMREVGENTFKISAGGPPQRWAVGLDAALKAAGLTSAQLASATAVTAADADGWISLAKAVPGDKQALVSAFLRVHPSKIFTDIAPG